MGTEKYCENTLRVTKMCWSDPKFWSCHTNVHAPGIHMTASASVMCLGSGKVLRGRPSVARSKACGTAALGKFLNTGCSGHTSLR